MIILMIWMLRILSLRIWVGHKRLVVGSMAVDSMAVDGTAVGGMAVGGVAVGCEYVGGMAVVDRRTEELVVLLCKINR